MDSTVCISPVYSSAMNYVKRHEPELTGLIPMCLNLRMAKKGHGKPSETEVEAIARRLISVRTAMGYSPSEFADRAGIARNTYSQWENAKGAPSRLEARKLKKAFGITLDYIFEDDPSALPPQINKKLVA